MNPSSIRIRVANNQPIKKSGKYVLYWMIAQRRTRWNFALDHALEHCRQLQKPLLIFEPLRSGYKWASDRLHHFVIQGMVDNQQQSSHWGVRYLPYLEPFLGAGEGLLTALAEQACIVVTDEFPCFFLPHMVEIAGKQLSVRLESVDSNGLVPLRATEKAYGRAFDFRRWLQGNLLKYLDEQPTAEPLADYDLGPAPLSAKILQHWPSISPADIAANPDRLQELPIDHSICPSFIQGGSNAGQQQLDWFLKHALSRYGEERSHPDLDAASGLSPYLHFGHVSVHEILHAVLQRETWRPSSIQPKVTGSSEGWWGTSPSTESFLDELITWRELGYHFCHHRPDYARYSSLPEWAQQTLAGHACDRRDHLYSEEQFALSQTHDQVWNAAQTQLREEGRMHNYLRMLWGKKIVEWSKSPREALRIMIELNNRYALDGRDPNSYSGIFWVLGRFDRPWAPERPVHGVLRYMSSGNTVKKLRMKQYLAKYSQRTASQRTLFEA